jgi:hypothetical protein
MGERSWIQIESKTGEVVSLYGHWSGEDNLYAVRNVMARTGRLHMSYLIAQLFYEFAMVWGNYDGHTGFGIFGDRAPDGDEYPTVFVDADTGKVTYDGVTYEPAELNDYLNSQPIGHA